MTKDDEGLRAVRAVREKISVRFGHDPKKLIQHYIEEQERFKDRLLQPGTVREDNGAGTYGRHTDPEEAP